MLVKEVMVPCSETLSPGITVNEAWPIIQQAGTLGLPVADYRGRLIGTLTRNDIFSAGPQCHKVTVNELMDQKITTITTNMPLTEAWKIPRELFPVVDENSNLIGLLDKFSLCSGLYQQVANMLGYTEVILDSAHNGIIAIDEEGIITIFNRAAEQITRRTKNEAIGKHLSQVIITQGLLEILKDGKSLQHHKFTVKYSQGTHTYITNRTPIINNGKIMGAIGVFQDISEIEFIYEELNIFKRLNKQLQAIIESSYDGILITDTAGIIIKANKAHQRITGIPSKDIQGKCLHDLIIKDIYGTSMLGEVVQKKKAVTCCRRASDNNHLAITGSPVFDEQNQVNRVVINVRDLTELNELRKELEESRELSKRYQLEINELRARLSNQDGMVFQSPRMQDLLTITLRVAQVNSTVLFLGESGVGKEITARILHKSSKRSSGPFVTVNCGAIPENLLESELFGYERGAFTGANKEGKAGLFELADRGTLFLDEIGDLPLHLQVKILRSIQSKEIIRVGGTRPRRIDVRFITATNKDLQQMVDNGKFREDLYFRINVVPLNIPPLRERKEDIIPLIYNFQKKFNKLYNINKEVSPEVFDILLEYSWPGNVRELENMIERLLVTTPNPVIKISDLPSHLFTRASNLSSRILVQGIIPLKQARLEMEKQLIKNALSQYGGINAAARALQVDPSTIVRKLQRINRV